MSVLAFAGLAGCAGVSPIQIGQTIGTIAGAVIAPGVGAPFGALLGTLAGIGVEQQVDKGREKQERVDLGKQLGPGPSAPGAAEVPVGSPTRVWVDERLVNGRLIGGHFDTQFLR